MTTSSKSSSRALQLRKLHRSLAPIMLLPILLTLVTGTFFQLFELLGQEDQVEWLIQLHKGNFGSLHLESVYPFFNSLGLLILTVTGFSMWRQLKRRPVHR